MSHRHPIKISRAHCVLLSTMPTTDVFPTLSRADILHFQFSAWYPRFKHLTFKSTIVRPLSEEFKKYLLSDGVHIPDGSENVCVCMPFCRELTEGLIRMLRI